MREPKRNGSSLGPVFGRYCLLDTPDARVRLAAMTSMASTLAHEVSQPLTATTNYLHACAQRLRDRGEDNDGLLKLIEHAASESLRAGEVVRRMRNFVVSGKVAGRRENLRLIVERAASSFSFPEEIDVEIIREVPLTEFVVADRLQIEQVLVNLVMNARDAVAGRDTRRVTIASAREEDTIVTTVEDSGSGIPVDMLERVFEPSFTTKPDGLGLGLPISRTIAEAHGGRLWAEAPAGGGARFSLLLPAAP